MSEEVIIIEDNTNIVNKLYKTIKSSNLDINIMKTLIDEKKIIEEISKHNIEIILLDLNLGENSGIHIIDELSKRNLKDVSIIIMSGDIELINKVNIMHNNMIKKILVKPFTYNDLLLSINEIIQNKNVNRKISKINDFLNNFNFNKKSKYYECLVECIEEIVIEETLIKDIEKCLYKEIAKRHRIKNEKNVKWGIEKLINSMIKYTDKEIINKYFPYGIPTPKLFIKEVVNRINE